MGFIVAVDGVAGSGKGSITKIIAQRLGLIAIDTGAMYRCVALECIRQQITSDELEKVKKVFKNHLTNLSRCGTIRMSKGQGASPQDSH